MGLEQTSAPAPSPVEPGETVAGKYLVERVLGVGGMGVVVAARHVHVQHQVALKFLAPGLAGDGASVTRFLREAQAVGAIRCEHVARVMDVGQTDAGIPFLVMEYLEGKDLARVLEQRGALPEAAAVNYILQALVAIAEAHALDIVHRDLKPSNLFLTEQPDGSLLVKVLDFGISKVAVPQGAGGQNLTMTGGLLGSPLYMSPEQIRSAKLVDTRSDIWSLGVILHELVTGKPPFTGEQVSGVLASIIADSPTSVRAMRPELSAGLERVIERCLDKAPSKRFPSVAELAQELAPLAGPEGQARVRRIVQTMRRAKGTPEGALDTSGAPVAQAHSAAGSPLIATAEGWSQPRGEGDRRALWRTGLALAVVLGAGGIWLAAKMGHAPSSPVAEPEAHMAAPTVPIAATASPANPPGATSPPQATPVLSTPEPDAASAPSTAPAPPPTPKAAHAKPAANAKLKPPAPVRPKSSGPRDPSELIDDRR
ncbi:MAG TPA: serine/threonine-protein kinase [Polyangiaceae bacterium]|nr:serine/threonine-protein kinase [Polyangiaceae bacterium]